MPLPYREVFGGSPLEAAWAVDVSQGNTIDASGDGLRIRAAQNTYAHIERPLGIDHIRASTVIKPGAGISWVSSLFLYWDPRNWCQISVLEHEPSCYAVELVNGQLREHRRPLSAKTGEYRLAVALGRDCVRYQTSPDGHAWSSWLVLDRPEPWRHRSPALLIVGKGFSRDEGEPRSTGADLDNDYPDRGSPTVSWIGEVSVERTPPDEIRLTQAEREERAAAGRDHLGELELAARADPSFASVSRHFPPMKHPRESLGVKNGPDEFVVLPDGSLDFAGARVGFRVGSPPGAWGEGVCARRLHEGWLPIVIATRAWDQLTFEQTAFGWSHEFDPDKPLTGFVRLRVMNPGVKSRHVPVELAAPNRVADWVLEVPGGGFRDVQVAIPFAQPAQARAIEPAEFDQRLAETAAWWSRLLARGVRIQVPEERVNRAWRAWLAWNFINVDKRGEVFEPHDGGGGFYEVVYGYSASRYAYALDMMGFFEDAQRYLDSILTFVTPEGLLMVNYGLPDTGTQLWAMSQHFRLTDDAAWLRRVAPTMIRMCDWIRNARQTSMQSQARTAPWHGLLKYRPYCDEPTPTYSFHTDTYLALGMRDTAAALQAVGLADPARRIATEAQAYQRDILRAMDRAAIQRDGRTLLPVFPETHALLQRVGYTGADYYSLVASMVLETGLLPARDRRARWITDLLERKDGLLLGACTFQGGIDHAYTYGYWLNCLERDDVKRVILGFYTSLAYGMSRDAYAGVEVTACRTGENQATLPHLYSGTQQLLLLRNMLLWEQGDDLWIGRAIPRPWLEEGKTIRVDHAPTLFGPVSFTVQSFEGARRLEVELTPPVKRPPKHIRLRLRHPEQRAIRSVSVNGAPSADFRGETVTLKGATPPVRVEVRY